jgi:hypothetical protein
MKNVLTEFPFCLIGMTEQQARKHCVDNDLLFRCVERNGSKVSHGRDARIDRISAAIDNDIIARAWFG